MKTLLGSLAVLIALCVAQAGCSSKSSPTNAPPPVVSPTHFAAFVSDRNRTAGAYRNYITCGFRKFLPS